MTRTETMARIAATLPALDDERLAAVADIVDQMVQPDVAIELTAEELAGIERSREDFRTGRTLSSQEYRTEIDAFMARLFAKYPSGP
jgi:hypothetical protein